MGGTVMDIEKVEREAEKLARMTQFWHSMVSDGRTVAIDPDQLVRDVQARLSGNEFVALVHSLALAADLRYLNYEWFDE